MSKFKFEVWPTEYQTVTQQFGANANYYSQFKLPGHEGVDIRARVGSKIFCVAPGKVSRVQLSPKGHNYGVHVRVTHEDGYETIYAHLSAAIVNPEDEVEAGTLLGYAGETGNSFGPHLHLGLKRRGSDYQNWPYDIIDPTPFLLPLLGWQKPEGTTVEGWVLSNSIYRNGELAQVHVDGAHFWIGPDKSYVIPSGTIVELGGNEREPYTLVLVTLAALGVEEETDTPLPELMPQPTISTVDGWALDKNLHITGRRAVVNEKGINLRADSTRYSKNIGLVKPDSTLTIIGKVDNGYRHVRVRRTDFAGDVSLPYLPPLPTEDATNTPDKVYLGWVESRYLEDVGAYTILNHRYGASFRPKPDTRAKSIGLVKGYATLSIAGLSEEGFTPVLVNGSDVLNPAAPMPPITRPRALPEPLDPTLPTPPDNTVPGWVLTSRIEKRRFAWRTPKHGLILRAFPQRNAVAMAFVQGHVTLTVLGKAQGEYTPVRIAEDELRWLNREFEEALSVPAPIIVEPVADPVFVPEPVPAGPWPGADPSGPWENGQPPSNDAPPPPPIQPDPPAQPDPPPDDAWEPIVTAEARIGLHASADPAISEAEIDTFRLLRPGVIKLLSSHDPHAISKLRDNHPNAHWIVRAFLDFGGRAVSPYQFVDWTLSDVQRTVDVLQSKPVVIELHNEPNLYQEGLGSAWQDGATFARWWLEVLRLYRKELPTAAFVYPGLSPGSSVSGVRQDHIQFIEASRQAVESADALGVHLYWSNWFPIPRALAVLDDYLARFRNKPIWITEASNNDDGVPFPQKGNEYIHFWQQLQSRSMVHGVTYFVASASDPAFASETWVGNGIAEIVGRR